ncbi:MULTISPECIES: cyclic-phosphate processing receiver domain-containing protein [unclassified Aliivibrio]|uniref:cyclic-phosphate processing receiver domain-containing protein n=1 Tax=unclassified Aliivibrio TaxID=2645654 RepID=UPI003083D170
MKVYLDDCRPTPSGWTRTYTPQQTIDILRTHNVTALSLDHDLGDDEGIGTGYTVLLWIEEHVVIHGYEPPSIISIHSSNPSARSKMLAAIETLEMLANCRK